MDRDKVTINAGMPFEKYLATIHPSFSTLKYAALSPLHLKCAIDREMKTKPSDAMLLGTALHTALLEPHLLEQRVALWEGSRRAGPEWADFKIDNEGKTILTTGNYDKMLAMTSRVRFDPVVQSLMERVEQTEMSVFGSVEGTTCKGRIDGLGPDIIIDIKSCRSVDKRSMAKSAFSLRYDLQRAVYTSLMPEREYFLVCVENMPPHDVGVFEFSPSFAKRGRDDLLVYLQMFQECSRTNHWPGRPPGPHMLDLPEWAEAQLADEITIEGEVAYG